MWRKEIQGSDSIRWNWNRKKKGKLRRKLRRTKKRSKRKNKWRLLSSNWRRKGLEKLKNTLKGRTKGQDQKYNMNKKRKWKINFIAICVRKASKVKMPREIMRNLNSINKMWSLLKSKSCQKKKGFNLLLRNRKKKLKLLKKKLRKHPRRKIGRRKRKEKSNKIMSLKKNKRRVLKFKRWKLKKSLLKLKSRIVKVTTMMPLWTHCWTIVKKLKENRLQKSRANLNQKKLTTKRNQLFSNNSLNLMTQNKNKNWIKLR